ncbi:hypothetical protein AB0B66_41070 [Catellatospora sp. NPDC049111]|uniref:hypothetical protein n=1 Tax=Catellatospora sp. NPDC049111 TaxID=3155271 RepID=UPI0033F21CC7
MPHHLSFTGERYEYEAGGQTHTGDSLWAVSDTLDVLLRTAPTTYYTVTAPALHRTALPGGASGNSLLAGLTVVRRVGGAIEQESAAAKDTVEPHKLPGVSGVAHSEFQAFLAWVEAAAVNLNQETTLAVIIEAHQTNTPCSTCQKLIGGVMVRLAAQYDKPVIFRGSALQAYETAPGALGRMLLSVRSGTGKYDTQTPPVMNDVLGTHLMVPLMRS